MTVIRPNSISGVTSITAQGGDINLFRADGTKADVPIVNNITAGVVTATKFVGPIEGNVTGNLSGGTINATSGTITGNLGVGGVLTYEDVTNVDSVGIITARGGIRIGAGTTVGPVSGIVTYFGDGSQLTGIDATKIETGNTKVETIDTGSDGHIKVTTEGTERLRIDVNGTITNTTNSSHSQGAGTFNVTGTINQYSQGSGSGLIFDCDFGRLTGYSDNASIGNGTNLSAALLHTTTDWTSSSSNTPMTVNGSSFGYRVGFGGYLDCVIHQGRVSIGAGSGSPNMAEKLNTASMTIESWVWYDGAGREIIASRYGTGFPNQFNMVCDPNGQFHYNNSGVGAGSGDVTGQNFPDKTWHHHVWQYDSSATKNRWYINGAFANETTVGSSLAVTSATGFSIASRADDNERWDGKIAVVRIYNRALSATEIKNHFELDRGRFGV